ncbi:MAG: Nif3-like dinuclear metal center hexameric protein [Clostridia bacterium]|nr:Nif3-like dinuclear metal center hexameric protein [Clostridia bacterium]
MKVSDLYAILDSMAPFGTQESFDNSGLLTGSMHQEVQGILAALDVTDDVLDEAERKKANVILTHHPLMFSPRKAVTEDDFEGRLLCRLVRRKIALIACHTNLDQAPGGINDTLASICGLRNIRGEAFVRTGDLPVPLTLSQLIGLLETSLRTKLRVMASSPSDPMVRRVAVSSGAGSSMWEEARDAGAQVFLSGEIKHHHALAMAGCGMIALEAGHFATENPGILAFADTLRRTLQSRADSLEWKGDVMKSEVQAYSLYTDL